MSNNKLRITISQDAVKLLLKTAVEERYRGEDEPQVKLEAELLPNGWWHVSAWWGQARGEDS